MASEELQDAVIRNVEVIGEAAKRVSAESRARMPALDCTGAHRSRVCCPECKWMG
jgi:uncharacterized protein with HEPN domain